MGGSNSKTTVNYLISLIDRVHKIYEDTVMPVNLFATVLTYQSWQNTPCEYGYAMHVICQL